MFNAIHGLPGFATLSDMFVDFVQPVRMHMDLSDGLATARNDASSPICGLPSGIIFLVFRVLTSLRSMRLTAAGEWRGLEHQRAADAELRRRLELQQVSLTNAQLHCLQQLHDSSDWEGVSRRAASLVSPSADPAHVQVGPRIFCTEKIRCCGTRLHREQDKICGVFERARCYRTTHSVMRCAACHTTYYFDRCVYDAEIEGDVYRVHLFYDMHGAMPSHYSNRAGKTLVATDLLHDFAVMMCTLR